MSGYVTGILHGATVNDVRIERCARTLGDARSERGLAGSWKIMRGELEVRLLGALPTSTSTCALITPTRVDEVALTADWTAFDDVFRALCVAAEPTHAYVLLYVDEDGNPKPATPAEIRWHTLASNEWPPVLPPRSFFGPVLKAIAPPALTGIAEPLGKGLYVGDRVKPDVAAMAAAFGKRMRPIASRFAVVRPAPAA